MFSIRIVTTDHYQGTPIPGLDVQYADFRASAVKKVPVIRVYGSTPQGMLYWGPDSKSTYNACFIFHGAKTASLVGFIGLK